MFTVSQGELEMSVNLGFLLLFRVSRRLTQGSVVVVVGLDELGRVVLAVLTR
jgi:hypothetical protein